MLGMAAGLAGGGPASAALLSTSDIFSQFNAVVFGSFATTAAVEGRTVVGGSMTRGASFNTAPGAAGASAFSALTVYGNQTGSGGYTINHGGGLTIAGSNAGTFMLNGGGSALIGGSSAGNIASSGGATSVAVGGSNTGTVNLNAGGSVSVGGSNTGQVTVNGGPGSVAVIGATTAPVTLNSGGSVYVGSNSPGGGISVNGGPGSVTIASGNAAQVTLNNGGSATIAGNTGNVSMNGGSLTYTGSKSGNVNLNGGATASKVADVGVTAPDVPGVALPAFGPTFQDQMTALSAQLDALTANSVARVAGHSITFAATPDADGRAVFDVDTSLFAPNSAVRIQLNDASTVIINVNVDSCVVNSCAFAFGSSVNFVNPNGYAERVLWNFTNATGLAFANEFGGTVLATLAAVSNRGAIDGTLVAASYDGSGELHSRPFSGSLTAASPPALPVPSATAAPEPSGLAALGVGLGALGWVRRRRGRGKPDAPTD